MENHDKISAGKATIPAVASPEREGRVRILFLDSQTLMNILFSWRDVEYAHFVLFPKLPEDAYCVSIRDNHMRRGWDLTIASQTFTPVPDGQMIPDLDPGPRESMVYVRFGSIFKRLKPTTTDELIATAKVASRRIKVRDLRNFFAAEVAEGRYRLCNRATTLPYILVKTPQGVCLKDLAGNWPNRPHDLKDDDGSYGGTAAAMQYDGSLACDCIDELLQRGKHSGQAETKIQNGSWPEENPPPQRSARWTEFRLANRPVSPSDSWLGPHASLRNDHHDAIAAVAMGLGVPPAILAGDPVYNCPDCTDGFYRPLTGEKEPCQTCKGTRIVKKSG